MKFEIGKLYQVEPLVELNFCTVNLEKKYEFSKFILFSYSFCFLLLGIESRNIFKVLIDSKILYLHGTEYYNFVKLN